MARRISVRLTGEELERLEAIAKAEGKAVAAATREAILAWIGSREAGR